MSIKNQVVRYFFAIFFRSVVKLFFSQLKYDVLKDTNISKIKMPLMILLIVFNFFGISSTVWQKANSYGVVMQVMTRAMVAITSQIYRLQLCGWKIHFRRIVASSFFPRSFEFIFYFKLPRSIESELELSDDSLSES